MPRYNASGASASDPTVETAGHDIAARARANQAKSSEPFGSASDLPDAFTQHVQARMKAQGEAESRKIGYEKSETGERIKGSY